MIALAAERDNLTDKLNELERTAKVQEATEKQDALAEAKAWIARMYELPADDDERHVSAKLPKSELETRNSK
jgi:hypothetical protein